MFSRVYGLLGRSKEKWGSMCFISLIGKEQLPCCFSTIFPLVDGLGWRGCQFEGSFITVRRVLDVSEQGRCDFDAQLNTNLSLLCEAELNLFVLVVKVCDCVFFFKRT